MPANLSPRIKAAEASFRKARDPRQRLDWLREMLRAIPKHKGTEHLQADIKPRIKELSEELEGGERGGGQRPRSGNPPRRRRADRSDRAAQRRQVLAAPAADRFQCARRALSLYDPVSRAGHDAPRRYPLRARRLAGGLPRASGTVACRHPADGRREPARRRSRRAFCLEQLQAVHAVLREKRVTLTERWNPGGTASAAAGERDEDPFAVRLPLILANKADGVADVEAELDAFRELTGLRYPVLVVSATTGRGFGEIGPWLFRNLCIVRVYTKAPGRPVERNGRSRCARQRSATSHGSCTRTLRAH